MSKLANSCFSRKSRFASIDKNVTVYPSNDRAYDHHGVVIVADIGTPRQCEKIGLTIPGDDYAVLIKEMIESNRRAFFDGLAKALLANPDPEPGPPR